MRSGFSCIVFATALLAADALADQAPMLQPEPFLLLRSGPEVVAAGPREITDIEISESGGRTDLFIRLGAPAAAALGRATSGPAAEPLGATICGRPVDVVELPLPVTSGTVYIADRTAQEGEAMRALWSGRTRCAALSPEVFSNAQ